MKILALDSSGLTASVAIVEDGQLRAEYTVNYKKTHSQTLLPMLDEIAKMIELDLETIDAIAVAAGPFQFAMINPVSTKKLRPYQTEEGCLSLEGVRPCTRYEEIEVDYLDSNFRKQHGKYTGWTAQIIQHEVDHCCGVVI